MKTGKTLTELAQELDRQNTAKRDFIVPSTELKMSDECQLGFPINSHREDMETRPVAHQQLGTHLGIPSGYYQRLKTEHPDLLATNVNRLLSVRPDTEQRMVRTLDGEARAFLSNRYRRIDNYDLAQVVLPILGEMEGMRIESCEVTERKLYIKAFNHKMKKAVKKDDIVEAGFSITNSEIGLGSVDIAPYVWRQWCLNGCKVNDMANKRRHVGRLVEVEDGASELYQEDTLAADDKAFMLRVRDMIRIAVDEEKFELVARRLRDASEEKITGDPIKAVELTAKTLSLNETEKTDVLRHLIEGGDLSRYGMLNAVTRTSQDVEDYDRASDLEEAGGRVLELSQTDWGRIATVKKATVVAVA